MTNLFVKKLVAAALCAASFFILHSLFFATPARAQLDCGAYGFEENGCCNYGDATRNLYHITADDSRCNSNHCERRSFSDDTFPYTDCNYCHRDGLCMRKDNAGGCAGVCNNNCCPPPDGEDEGDCHMEDKNLTTCCPVEDVAGSAPSGLWDNIHNLLEMLGEALWNTKLPLLSLKVEDFKVSEKFDEAIDYYYGKMIKNEEGEDEIDPGVFFKLAPPNLLEEQLPTEEDKVTKRQEWARWEVSTKRESGTSGEGALNDGKLRNEAYPWAVTYLRDFLVAIPKMENSASSYKAPKTTLASYPSLAANPQSSGEVLAATDLCAPEVVPADTEETCTPPDAEGKDATVRDLYNIFTGEGLFPKLADLDKIGRFTAGDETEDGASEEDAFDDPHYEDGGFLEIFKLPTEEYIEHNAKGVGNLKLNFTLPIVNVSFEVNLGSKELELRHQGSDTEAREKPNGVYAKLSVPQAENGTALLRQTPSVVLASNPSVQGSYYPQNISFAEKIGHTLGSWLSKLIAL